MKKGAFFVLMLLTTMIGNVVNAQTDGVELFFSSWVVDGQVVTVAKRGDTVIGTVSLASKPRGQYRIRVMQDFPANDEVVEEKVFYHDPLDPTQPFISSITFEPPNPTGEWGTIGYYIDVHQYSAVEGWVEVWTMPSEYPPRLKISPWRIETIDSTPSSSCLELDSNNYPHVCHIGGGQLVEGEWYSRPLYYKRWNGTHWEDKIVGGGGTFSFTLDSDGRPHLVYQRGAAFFHSLWYATLVGSEWDIGLVGPSGDPEEEEEDWGYANSIATDSTNVPHLVYGWSEYTFPGPSTDEYLVYGEITGTWSEAPYTIPLVEMSEYEPFGPGDNIDMALDSFDNPHLIIDRSRGLTVGSLVYYKRTDSTWSILPDSLDHGRFGTISIAIDSHNRAHVSYYDALNGDLKYVYYTESGWSTPLILDSEGDVGSCNSIAVDSYDDPHISYIDRTNGALKYIKRTREWSSPEIIDSAGVYDTSIAVDSNNYVHITYATQMEGYEGEDALKYATAAPVPPVVLDITAADPDGGFTVTMNAGAAKGAPVSGVSEVSKSNIASYHVSLTDQYMVVIIEGQLEDPSLPGQIVLEVDPNGIVTYKVDISPQEPIPSVPPIAVISAPSNVGVALGSVEARVTFDPTSSYDSDGSIELYEWDFDSDGYIDDIGTVPAHVSCDYSIGTHQVTLRVTDNYGLTGTSKRTIVVLDWWPGFLMTYGSFIILVETVVLVILGAYSGRKYITKYIRLRT